MSNVVGRVMRATKGWRTMALSLLLALVGVLQTADWTRIVSADQVGPVMLGVGILGALLRVLTDTPVGCRHEDEG